jgi:hypothetical protein
MLMYTVAVVFATLVAAVTFYIHTFVGGKRVAAPLLEDRSLPVTSKWLNYYCWHIATVLIAFMTGGFAWLVAHPHLPSLIFLSNLAFALSVLSIAVALKAGINPLRFPSTTLFAVIALACAVAILGLTPNYLT